MTRQPMHLKARRSVTRRGLGTSSAATMGLLAGAVAMAALIGFMMANGPTPTMSAGSSRGIDEASARGPIFSWEETLEHPLDDGIPTTIENARRQTPYQVPMPDHAAANRANLHEVFRSPANHVALVFESDHTPDILVITQHPDFQNPSVEFAELIASGTVPNGRLDVVKGQTALVMEPNTDEVGANPGSLQYVHRGVSITIYGRNVPGEDLRQIGESMR